MDTQTARWFAEADVDADGSEAKVFFQRSGLRKQQLGQAGIELDEDTVDMALQSPHEWHQVYGTPFPTPTIAPTDTNSLVDAFTAMHTDGAAPPLQRVGSGSRRPPPPIPTGNAGGAQLTFKPSFQPRRRAPVAAPTEDAPKPSESPPAPPPRPRGQHDELGSSVEAEPPTPNPQATLGKPALRPSRPAPLLPGTPESDVQGAMAATKGAASGLMRTKAYNYTTPSRRFSESASAGAIYLDARLPPLDPGRSAQLLFLTAGFGSLFAGPVHQDRPGLLLQWGRAEGSLRLPEMPAEHMRACEGWQQGVLREMASKPTFAAPSRKVGQGQERAGVLEDVDAAPSATITVAGHKVGCVVVDEAHGLLWVGDRDGMIAAYDCPPGGLLGEWREVMCARPSPRYQFQAFSAGSVTAMARAATGALWAGSARGSLRVFEFDGPRYSKEPSARRELRRGGAVLGPVLPRAHQRRVIALVSTHDGRVVWSVTSSHLCLWCASSGIFMGELARKAIADLRDVRDIMVPQAVQRIYQDNGKVLADKGLVGGDGGCLDDTGISLNTLERAEAAYAGQLELISRSDNAISETLTFGLTNAKQIGKTLVKTGGKGVKMLLDAASKGIMKAGRDVADSLADDVAAAGPRAKGDDDVLSMASSLPLDRPSATYGGATESQQLAQQPSGSSPGDIVAITAAACNTVWVGCDNGLLEQYTSMGRLLNSVNTYSPVLSLASVGERVWAGLGCGAILVFETAVRTADDGTKLHDVRMLHRWDAAPVGIASLAPAGTRVYSLALDGGVRGWPAATPSAFDAAAWDRWQSETQKSALVTRSLRIFAVTWNVNELQPDTKTDAEGGASPGLPGLKSSKFFTHLRDVVAGDPSYKLAVIGLQEIEMGGTSVAAAAARDLFGQRKAVERGNQAAQAWAQRLLATMNEGEKGGAWFKVGMRQLCGILVCVFARVELRPVIGEVATSHVTTGVLGNRGGNKGAVALRFTLWRRTFTVIVSHFAAHQHNIDERNANYASIVRRLKFKRHIAHPNLERLHRAGETARQRGGGGGERGGDAEEDSLHAVSDSESDREDEAALGEEEHTEALRSSEAMLWLGDFNYRLDLDYTTALAMIEDPAQHAMLVSKDQCIEQMKAGKVFVGLAEGPIRFLPTYKFDKPGKAESADRPRQIHGYDSSEKRRVPSFTDRIFFRGSKPMPRPGAAAFEEESVDLLGLHQPEVPKGLGPVVVQCEQYDSLMDVVDSDHKPVFVSLRVELKTWDTAQRRRVTSTLLKHYYRPAERPMADLQPAEGQWAAEQYRAPRDDSSGEESVEDSGGSGGEADEGSLGMSHGSGSGRTRRRDRLKAKAQRFAKNISKWSAPLAPTSIPMLRLAPGAVASIHVSNRGATPLLFRLVQAQAWSGFDRCITVWPAMGTVGPHSVATLRVAGAEAKLPKQAGPMHRTFEVLVSGEYAGGDVAPLVLRFAVLLLEGGAAPNIGCDEDDSW